MKSVIIATLIASAAAFAPAQQKTTSTSLAAFEDELGVQVRCFFLFFDYDDILFKSQVINSHRLPFTFLYINSLSSFPFFIN
jgi:hypothetical protein